MKVENMPSPKECPWHEKPENGLGKSKDAFPEGPRDSFGGSLPQRDALGMGRE